MINVNWHMSPLFWIIYAQKKTLQLLWITYLLYGQLVVLWDDYKILFCYHQNVLQNCWFVICFPFLPLWSLQHKRLTMRTSKFHICLSTHNSTKHATDFYDDTGQLMRWKLNLHIVFADWKRARNILKEKKDTYHCTPQAWWEWPKFVLTLKGIFFESVSLLLNHVLRSWGLFVFVKHYIHILRNSGISDTDLWHRPMAQQSENKIK